MLDMILAGLSEALQLANLLFVLLGVIAGMIAGAIPGVNGPMARPERMGRLLRRRHIRNGLHQLPQALVPPGGGSHYRHAQKA